MTARGRGGRRPAQRPEDRPSRINDQTTLLISDEAQEFLTTFASAETILIWRKLPSGEESYCGSMPVAIFDIENVREVYGGGRYRILLRDGEKKYIKGSSRMFVIDGPPRETPATPSAATPAALPSTTLDRVLERLDRLAIPAPPQESSIEGAVRLITMLRAIDGGGSKEPPITQIVGAFREGMQIARESEPPPPAPAMPESNGYAGVVAQFVNPITRLIEHVIERDRQDRLLRRGVVPATMPAPAPAPPAASSPAPVLIEGDAMGGGGWYTGLLPHIPRLLRWAAADSSPLARAEILLESIPDDVQAAMAEHLKDPATLDRLLAVVPGASSHRKWFAAFTDGLCDCLELPRLHEKEWLEDDGGPAPEVVDVSELTPE